MWLALLDGCEQLWEEDSALKSVLVRLTRPCDKCGVVCVQCAALGVPAPC